MTRNPYEFQRRHSILVQAGTRVLVFRSSRDQVSGSNLHGFIFFFATEPDAPYKATGKCYLALLQNVISTSISRL